MFVPHNTYRLSQHYKRHVCVGPVNIDFGGYVWFLSISKLYGCSMLLKTFLVNS